jgi:hypothetical protein
MSRIGVEAEVALGIHHRLEAERPPVLPRNPGDHLVSEREHVMLGFHMIDLDRTQPRLVLLDAAPQVLQDQPDGVRRRLDDL